MIKDKFEQFLAESFHEGVSFRELRLSPSEVRKLTHFFPKATITKISEDSYSKAWYEVNINPHVKRYSKTEKTF